MIVIVVFVVVVVVVAVVIVIVHTSLGPTQPPILWVLGLSWG
jgi:hypothetical protein